MLTIDQSYDGRTVTMPLGQVMELRLAENPTTGFAWSVEKDGAPACAVDGSHFRVGSAQPGAPGEHIWTIHGIAAGDCEIELAYRRRFEQGGTDAPRTFRVEVRVTP